MKKLRMPAIFRIKKTPFEQPKPLAEPTVDERRVNRLGGLFLKIEELRKNVLGTRKKIIDIAGDIKDASLVDLVGKAKEPSPEIERMRQESVKLKENLAGEISQMKDMIWEARSLVSQIEGKKTQALFRVVVCHFSLMDVQFQEAARHSNDLNDTITNFSGMDGSNANNMPSLLSSKVISGPEARLVNAKREMEENAKSIGSILKESLHVQGTGAEMHAGMAGVLASISGLYTRVAENARCNSLYDGANVYVQGRQYGTAKAVDLANVNEREIRKMLREGEVFSGLGQLLECCWEANGKSAGKDRVADGWIDAIARQLKAIC